MVSIILSLPSQTCCSSFSIHFTGVFFPVYWKSHEMPILNLHEKSWTDSGEKSFFICAKLISKVQAILTR